MLPQGLSFGAPGTGMAIKSPRASSAVIASTIGAVFVQALSMSIVAMVFSRKGFSQRQTWKPRLFALSQPGLHGIASRPPGTVPCIHQSSNST